MGQAEQISIPVELQRVGSQRSKQRYVFKGLPVSRKPQWRIVFPMFVDWLCTVAVSLSIFGVLYFYSEDLPIMGRSAKRVYNGIMTGLSIFLGLVVSAGFNETMLTMRWWIMNRRYLSVQKIEKILQVENLKEMAMLACKTTRFRLLVAITGWIALVVASQVAVAALGLAYGLEVVGEQALIDKTGSVVAPDMSRMPVLQQYDDQSLGDTITTKGAFEYAANSYGLVSLAYGVSQQASIPQRGQLRDATDPLLFCTGPSCSYVFYERAAPSKDELESDADAANKKWRLIAATDRSITVTSMCNPWRVVAATWTEDMPIGNLGLQNPSGGSSPFNITFPVLGARNQTVFVVTNTTIIGNSIDNNNANDISKDCGTNGCAFVSAIEYTPDASWFYTCWTNTSTVTHAAIPEHEVAKSIRDLAAKAIGLGLDLSGSASSDLAPANSSFLSMQIYPSRSPVVTSNGNGNASEIAASLSRYAIGVIAVAAEIGPSQIIPGAVPHQGVTLKVDHWVYVVLILGSVVGCHFMLTLLAAWVAVKKVVVPPGGPLAHAQIFRPIAGFLSCHSRSGSVEGENEYSDRARLSRWRYQCVWIEEEGKYDLFLEEDPLTAASGQGSEVSGYEETETLLVSRRQTAPVAFGRQ